MQPIKPFSISAPGFYGLNLQDAPVDLSPNFALKAENCVIDKSGRIAARKGWIPANATSSALGTSTITCIGQVVEGRGTTTTIATSSNNKIFKLSSGSLIELTYGGGGVAPTFTGSNWKFCQLNGIGMFWQRGHDPIVYQPSVSTTTYRRLSEVTLSSGTIYQCNEAISAYGRIWCADNGTDRNTVVWSDIITPQVWTGGTSGSLNLSGVWPIGGDQIVGLAAHNNFLIIFGRKQTLIYSNADDPANMTLSDSLPNIGCIARDSIATTGDDVIFLSNSGVRSIARTIQEKSAPLKSLSKNVLDEIQAHVAAENTDNIKSVYSSIDDYYLLTMPIFNETYCFDLKQYQTDGIARVTVWTQITPSCFCETLDRKLYIGKSGYIGQYSGYIDNTLTYRMVYYTTWIDFGDPIRSSILKKIMLTIVGASNQAIIFKWGYDFIQSYFSETVLLSALLTPAEYGISEYNSGVEYMGNLYVNTLSSNGSGSGKVLQFGFEAAINGRSISVQKIDLYTKDGRY